MSHDESPAARALLLLEAVQASPGITGQRLAARLGVTERAVRRYVGTLRDAGVPIASARGPYGGYRIGRGYRVPPLMFTTAEALGLVMAVMEGRQEAADPADPVGSALGKILRVLPEPVAAPAEALRGISAADPGPAAARPDAGTAAVLVQAAALRRRVRVTYRRGPDGARDMDVDPWAVVVREGRWYLLCWSHARDARRLLRIDRVTRACVLADAFSPPDDLDPPAAVDEQLAHGWRHRVEVVVDAPVDEVVRWIPRSLARCEAIAPDRTRLLASTDTPGWYAHQLTALRAPFHVIASEELRTAVAETGRRLLASLGDVRDARARR
ncbi:Predicted DNA-binding transcriptional regulator YafY, contains an HTH and WYL domains [Actinacidiphila rubida]|uniref:Predicted DNA-binding transcriptional regulator YafY, contains an HTH and WYL domains n=2 Tax=Actinacidiphila rubida TaxID=310780 RepID=A0A1H8T877_9ACTN|nr:WYL domain-containing protein [Actinacidiphila rubida]SEO87015.1 Predicted DNA-binding transcriptional regulator YafY, contains an HTH and WYL domains [Actinacidiphila rubida]